MHHAPPCISIRQVLAVAALIWFGNGIFVGTAHADPAPAKIAPLPVKALPKKATRRAKPPRWSFEVKVAPRTASPYTTDTAAQHLQAVAFDLALVTAVSIYVGIDQWGWGETRFHFYSEHWFGKNTEYGGIDKLGHAWSGQVMSDYLTWRLQTLGYDKYQAAITAALISEVAFLGVEIGDGFSHYGFSYEDFIASSAGIAFSFLRNTVPGLADKVDYRMQYIPTGHGDSFGLGDYSGKKFVLAWKFAGFEAFKDTALRYFEIHTGYYTRGYNDWERAAGIPQTRTPYIGVGLNLSELLFSSPAVRDTAPASLGRALLGHIQVPYTYIASDNFR